MPEFERLVSDLCERWHPCQLDRPLGAAIGAAPGCALHAVSAWVHAPIASVARSLNDLAQRNGGEMSVPAARRGESA